MRLKMDNRGCVHGFGLNNRGFIHVYAGESGGSVFGGE